MANKSSRFGLNLFFQFVIIVILGSLTDYSDVFEALTAIMSFILFFGLVYGVFRLFGAKGVALESFYQNFPFGFWEDEKHEWKPDKPGVTPAKPAPSFSWRKFFSFQYLRYAGFLLIFSAIFSLLFQIEWELYQKIIITLVFGAAFLVLAEVLYQKNKLEYASTSSLISFGLFQFGLTLLYSFYADASGLISDPYFWLGVKTVFSALFLFTLYRYPSKPQPFLYFSIAYLSPFSMVASANLSILSLEYLVPSVVGLSVLLFWVAFVKRSYALLTLNVVAFNLVASMFISTHSLTPLIFLSSMFLVHLLVLLVAQFRERENEMPEQMIHNIVLHAVTLLNILYFIDSTSDLPSILIDYPGIVLLGFAALTYIVYMITQSKDLRNNLTEMLLNTSIIVSSIGLLLQVDGKWTAIIFLAYSCLILWYGIHKKWLRTIIYGFVFLTISIVKLYYVSPEIFESFTGSGLVLLIGVVLLGLSYKFEKIKDYFEHFEG